MIVITIWRRRDFHLVSTGKFRETPLNSVSVVMLYSYSMIVITIWRRRDFLQVSKGKYRETPLNTVSLVMLSIPTA
jgi:hypothetical protein